MIKIFLTVLVFYSGFIFSQSDPDNPNVELPDFVITGSDVISIRRVEKMKPDFIPTITDEFLKPTFKPEELEIAEISNPIEGDMRLLDSSAFHKGKISLELGRYTVPAGEINYAFPFERGMFHGILSGSNNLEYVDFSDRVTYTGKLDFNYSLANDSDVLPGTKFLLGGEHTVNKYNLFGSVTPEAKRTLNAGNAILGIQSLYGKKFIFDFQLKGDFTYLDTENYNEAIFQTKFFGKYKLKDFALIVKADYQGQSLTTDILGDDNTDYFFFRPTASFKIFNKFLAEGGFTFSRSGDEFLNNIYASLSAEVSKNFVILGEYTPVGEYLTSGKMLRQNFYFNPQSYNRLFIKKKNMVNIALVYEYDQYFQIDGGLRYFRTGNIPYYNDPDTTGVFQIATTDAKQFSLYTNLLFHLGPYGIFYGSFELLDLNNSDGKRIPYQPVAQSSVTYGYPFTPQFMGKVILEHLSSRFTDIENTDELEGVFNLGAVLEYKLRNNILLSLGVYNILGTKIYYWDNYQERPFELMLGASLLFD
ncbi:MAG TPA: hypothetical protein VH917_01205 [Ignavibacteriaceae bacterium]